MRPAPLSTLTSCRAPAEHGRDAPRVRTTTRHTILLATSQHLNRRAEFSDDLCRLSRVSPPRFRYELPGSQQMLPQSLARSENRPPTRKAQLNKRPEQSTRTTQARTAPGKRPAQQRQETWHQRYDTNPYHPTTGTRNPLDHTSGPSLTRPLCRGSRGLAKRSPA